MNLPKFLPISFFLACISFYRCFRDIWPSNKETLNWTQWCHKFSHPRKWFPQSEMMCMPRRNEPQKGGESRVFSCQRTMWGPRCRQTLQKFTQGAANSRIWAPHCTKSAANSSIWGCHCTENAVKFQDFKRLGRLIALKMRQTRGIGCLLSHILEFKGLFWQHFQCNPCLPLSWGPECANLHLVLISFWALTTGSILSNQTLEIQQRLQILGFGGLFALKVLQMPGFGGLLALKVLQMSGFGGLHALKMLQIPSRIWGPPCTERIRGIPCTESAANSSIWGCHCTENAVKFQDFQFLKSLNSKACFGNAFSAIPVFP